MEKRGSAVDFVQTSQQFENLLRTAAAIEDEKRSIECFALLLLMGRYGLRAGELIHVSPGWEDPQLPGIRIPTFHDCNCGYCQTGASRRVDDTGKTKDELLESYWSPKSRNGARPVVLETERAREAVDRYFVEFGNAGLSYSTIYRRVVKMVELTDGVSASKLTPQVLRATAASHRAGSGLPPSVLQIMMGWHDPGVAEYYVKISGAQLHCELLKSRGRDPSPSGVNIEPKPSTWEEMRPDKAADRLEVDEWTLSEQDLPAHPRQTEEEMIRKTVLDDFGDSDVEKESDDSEVLSSTLAGLAVSLAAQGGDGLQRRARAEERAMDQNPELADPTPQHAATVTTVALLPALALVSAFALGDGAIAATGMLLGAGYSIRDIDL